MDHMTLAVAVAVAVAWWFREEERRIRKRNVE
jgi:hypothetical protein